MSISSTPSRADRFASLTGSAPGVLDSRLSYAVIGAAALLFFYLHLFRPPFVPIFHPGDQTLYLEHAERMLHGEVLYRDLFQFNLPGTEYLYEWLFRGFGVQMWVGDLALLLALTGVTVMVYALARLVLHGMAALLPVAAFLVICQRSAIDGSHHWYSTLLVLLAIYLIAKFQTTLSYGLAGTLLALATMFTTSRGPAVAAGVSLFFLWKYRGLRNASKAIAALLVPLAVEVGAVLVYLANMAGTKTIFDSLLVFPLRYYSKGLANDPSVFFDQFHHVLPLRPLSVLMVIHWFAIDVAAPLFVILFLARCFRHRTKIVNAPSRSQTLILYALAGGFALLAAANAPAAPRLNCGSAFAYILAAAMLVDLGRKRLITAVLAFALAAGLAEAAAAVHRPKYVFTGPRGPVAFLDRNHCQGFAMVYSLARPGDELANDTELGFVLGLKDPAATPWVESDEYTRPEQVAALMGKLEQRPVRFVIMDDDDPAGVRPGDNLAPLRAYLSQHYHLLESDSENNSIYILNAP